jgi:NAD(P)H-hydrate epimerase
MAIAVEPAPAGALDEEAAGALLAAAAARSVVAAGPGLGRAAGTLAAIRRLALATDRPLVLDADGLAAFEGCLETLAGRSAPTVLTPHPGELARLLGRTSAEVQADRLAAARAAAAASGAVVVLKGDRTLIAAPDGEAWINDSGGPALATGGSGDVLTGLLAARLAQGDEVTVAAALAVHLHGLAGELAAERSGGPALPAGQLADEIPAAYRRLSGR